MSSESLPEGIYCPVITWFKLTPHQDLDTEAHVAHVEWLARANITGVVVMGSTAEAVGHSCPVMVGTVGAQTTRQAIERCRDGAENGASFALVLPPSYYVTGMTDLAIQSFYEEVATQSPIPIVVYSYPAVCSGIDMSTDLISKLSLHPKIVGIKHTDHNVGKMARLAASKLDNFTILGGATDYLLGTLAVGGHGAITGLANIAPRSCLEAYNLFKSGKLVESQIIAGEISKAEWALGKGALTGTKYATAHFRSLPESMALPRRPLLPISQTVRDYTEV